MRSFFILCALGMPVFAADPPAQPAPGHSFPDGQSPQISLEFRLVSGPPVLFQELRKQHLLQATGKKADLSLPEVSDEEIADSNGIRLVSATTVMETQTPVFTATLNDDAVRGILQSIQSDVQGNVMLAPKVTLFNRQTALIQDTTSRPFVVGLTPREQGYEPQIRSVDDGTKMAVRCQLRPEKSVRLDLRIRLSAVEDVGLMEAGPPGTTIQVPQVDAHDIQLAARVAAGQTLVVGGISKRIRATAEMGVPLLNNVPYVSRMFKNSGTGTAYHQMLILVTPRIIEGTQGE